MTKALYEAKQNDGIQLNANESYQNIHPVLLEKCKEALNTIAFHRYPQDDCLALRKQYALYAGVDVEYVMAGNGSDELLGLLITLCLKGGKTLYTLEPDFSMYDYFCEMANGTIYKYSFEPKTLFDVEAFIKAGRSQNIGMILFSNPNNPTGQMMSCATIVKILDAYPTCPVVVDEAYVDFADETMIPYLNKYPNLIILRTMSKAFGMASIRCGFMLACPSTMAQIMPYKVPYNVNSMTQAVGTILLENAEYARTFVKEISLARDAFYQEWQTSNLQDIILYPSKANYLYGKALRKDEFIQALEDNNIHIRNYKGEDTFRITIGSKEENEMVMKVMKDVFHKELTI